MQHQRRIDEACKGFTIDTVKKNFRFYKRQIYSRLLELNLLPDFGR